MAVRFRAPAAPAPPALSEAAQNPRSICVPCPRLHSLAARGRAAPFARALYMYGVCCVQWNQSKDEYMGKKQDEIFQDQIAFLVKREKYNLSDFHDGLRCARALEWNVDSSSAATLRMPSSASARVPPSPALARLQMLRRAGIEKAGLEGWRKHMPGVKSDPGAAAFCPPRLLSCTQHARAAPHTPRTPSPKVQRTARVMPHHLRTRPTSQSNTSQTNNKTSHSTKTNLTNHRATQTVGQFKPSGNIHAKCRARPWHQTPTHHALIPGPI